MSCSFIQNILKLTYRTKFTIVCKIVYLIFYLAEKKIRGEKKSGQILGQILSGCLQLQSRGSLSLAYHLKCSAKILLFGLALEFICAQSPTLYRPTCVFKKMHIFTLFYKTLCTCCTIRDRYRNIIVHL